ncbi:helix-turn-helix transcriptional regulator [Nocardia sp. NPDC005978]|uniref:helix-turn-helix transcriptional regulator n=1 Tax=Nocardia sp. NPDC005978 TaxID=3156725 RepID=UPI0033A3B2C2
MAGTSKAARELRREQLRDFLRTRRARLTPADVGIVSTGTRRTPGLRREEVALLAGVGVSWYTWLEQGRDINVSGSVVRAIGRALQLDDAEMAHLFTLAGLTAPPPGRHGSTRVGPELRRVINAWTAGPALLRDRYWNILAINAMTRAVFGYGDADHNCLISFFTNERYRAAHPQWEATAPAVVAAFRADAAQSPGDPEFERVIAELHSASVDFGALWARHDVAVPRQGVKAITHPEAGELHFDTTTLAVTDQPSWFLELYHPRPESGTAERLVELDVGVV